MRFVLVNASIGLAFDSKDPFRAYNILVMQMWYITLGACSLEHGDLFVHSFPLLRPVLMGLSFIE